MITERRARAARWVSGFAVVLTIGALPLLAQSVDTFVGRRLEEALRVLQSHGLRLVFSSELVTPDMRVRAEPRARAARERLAEMLRPHGLTAESGPGGIIRIVRARKPAAERPVISPGTVVPPKQTETRDGDAGPAESIYREHVTVTALAGARDEVSAGIDRQLASDELNGLGGRIADDPLRVVQALPGVATGDDFRSEYSVRGSAYRQAGVIIDGVAAPWLQHAGWGRGDTGTMTMLRGDLVQDAALQVGAYPRVDGSQIGPQLNLTLREGSRAHQRFMVGVSGTSATATAEGPLGSSARGSWLIGVRRSHSEWPVGRQDEHAMVFGFSDLQSKIVYDVRARQQLSMSVVAGLSNVEREVSSPFALGDGLNRAAMVSVAWRSVLGARTVVTQRVSSLAHDFSNRTQTVAGASRGTNDAGMYRVDLSQPVFRGVIEAGGQVRRLRGSRHGLWAPGLADDLESSWLERAGHASFRRPIGSAIVTAGLRLSDSTLVNRRAVDRWLQGEWSFGSGWLVHGSTGVTHQFPALEQVAGWSEPSSLRPEGATSVDLGIGHRLSGSVRWDATVFARRERDVLREPDLYVRLIDGRLDSDDNTIRFENALTGSAHGVELTLARRSQTGVSGWIGYSYGIARHVDTVRQEAFASDFDQRHAINATGMTTLPWKAKLGLTFRGSTNVPIPGYLATRNGELFAGRERNRVRLPAYARLDVRTERSVDRSSRRFTIFAEALNVLNRVNLGPADGAVLRDTGQAIGFTERLFPRLLTAGLRLEF